MNKISGREGGSGDGTAVHGKTIRPSFANAWDDSGRVTPAELGMLAMMRHRTPYCGYMGLAGSGIRSWPAPTIEWRDV